MYMHQRNEILTVDSTCDSSKFVCHSFYPLALHNTLKDISISVNGVYCDLVVVDMCNYINAWNEPDIIEIFFSCLLIKKIVYIVFF